MTMKKPELEVVRFAAEDVIATSGVASHVLRNASGEAITTDQIDLDNVFGVTLVCNDTCNEKLYHSHYAANLVLADSAMFVNWKLKEGQYEYYSMSNAAIGDNDKWYCSEDGNTWYPCGSGQ